MIGTSKPLASLSSSLLARKGQARPAMRPQGFLQVSPAAHEDLGWNDMGEDFGQGPAPAPYVAPVEHSFEAPKPEVLRQIEALDEQLGAPAPQSEVEPEIDDEAAEPEPVQLILARPMKREPVLKHAPAVSEGTLARVAREVSTKKAKAAFTLRLDHQRHLRLRLASAVTGRSAQHLVTEALDQFLESLEGIDALASQIDPATPRG
jgi:predicted DNA-binding protein